jgi:protein-tyrosine phosphatase
VIIDLDGDLDVGVPTMPNHMLYVYFPFNDGDPPDCVKLHAVGQLGATLIKGGHKVLSHCGLGYNRSALVAGMVLMHLGLSGEQAVNQLRQKRPGALFNKQFASYLLSCELKLVRFV